MPSQDGTFTGIAGGASQPKWQSLPVLPRTLLASLIALPCFSPHRSLRTLLLTFSFLLPYSKPRRRSLQLSLCSRGRHPAESHPGVAWGPLAGQQKTLAVPSHPARPRCGYPEAPAKLLCLGDHWWEHGEQEVLVFVLILCLALTNGFFVPTVQCLEPLFFFLILLPARFSYYSYNNLCE